MRGLIRAGLWWGEMMIKMNSYKVKTRSGSALLVVLFVVMAITVIALGVFARTDMDLASSRNIILKTQMDYLAHSGLEHAKTLMINPQLVDTAAAGYWQGGTGLQIINGSDDYYDLAVVQQAGGPTRRCGYTIQCNAYHMDGAQKIGQSRLTATLRLHPCIAYWQEEDTDLPSEVTIFGDMYCDDDINVFGVVRGDVYSKYDITDFGTIIGQMYDSQSTPPVESSDVRENHFDGNYQYQYNTYTAELIPGGTYPDLQKTVAGAMNPASIYYCPGSLELSGNCQINGTLIVKTDLKLMSASTSLVIQPEKNYPALCVDGDLLIDQDNCHLTVNGLVQVGKQINMNNKPGSSIHITGGLYFYKSGPAKGEGFINTTGGSVTITADPEAAALYYSTSDTNVYRWTPVGGAFYSTIER